VVIDCRRVTSFLSSDGRVDSQGPFRVRGGGPPIE
jgi:hypothetical protein